VANEGVGEPAGEGVVRDFEITGGSGDLQYETPKTTAARASKTTTAAAIESSHFLHAGLARVTKLEVVFVRSFCQRSVCWKEGSDAVEGGIQLDSGPLAIAETSLVVTRAFAAGLANSVPHSLQN
jgi:hypothetical protein